MKHICHKVSFWIHCFTKAVKKWWALKAKRFSWMYCSKIRTQTYSNLLLYSWTTQCLTQLPLRHMIYLHSEMRTSIPLFKSAYDICSWASCKDERDTVSKSSYPVCLIKQFLFAKLSWLLTTLTLYKGGKLKPPNLQTIKPWVYGLLTTMADLPGHHCVDTSFMRRRNCRRVVFPNITGV